MIKGSVNIKRHMLKNEIETFPLTILKMNSKWIKNLNLRFETIKLLEESIWRIFLDINYRNIFLDQSSKAKK